MQVMDDAGRMPSSSAPGPYPTERAGETAEGRGVDPPLDPPEPLEPLEALMRASRVITAVVAGSLARDEDVVTMPQMRVLVLVASRADVGASAVAETLGIHLSSASRICERLVAAGLLTRREAPADRRQIELGLTPAGAELIASIMDDRRTAFAAMLAGMSDRGPGAPHQRPRRARRRGGGAAGAAAAALRRP